MSVPIDQCRTIFGMRFQGVNHLVCGLHNDTTHNNFLKYFLEGDFADEIKSITQRHSNVGVFEFPWQRVGPVDKDVYASRFLGPSSESLIAREYLALDRLYQRISRTGFNSLLGQEYSVVHGIQLTNAKGENRFVVLQGNHRLAVLAKLGTASLKVLITATFNEKDVKTWPGVVSGNFTCEQALQCFSAFFAENDIWLDFKKKYEQSHRDRYA